MDFIIISTKVFSIDKGEILDEKLTIVCKEKSVRIIEIQKEGKTKQSNKQFLLGNNLIRGENLNNV